MTCTEPAYAKLNLSLDIVGRRSDGYHDMRMVMQSVTLRDTVTLEERGDGALSISASLPFLPCDESNIAAKAARQFFAVTGLPFPGLDIDIRKSIPVCAGMAGGSSDGAAVLRALGRAYAPDLPPAALEAMAAAVGSDVPFCVRGGTALAEGRGEALTDLPGLPACWFVLCKPGFSISTPELFAQVRCKRLRCRPDTAGLRRALEAGDLEGAARRMYNVFETVLPRKHAQVFEIKGALLDLGALAASMTGSGPTVFGLFRDRDRAETAAEALRARYPAVFLCQPSGRAV
ncbi:MAG: 4-(cytidine 5'-diphospho)-2-C-methyl-D-erythritol kinase [Oscillospiraceae bacterium]|nr:4-(cytidine 5'-diphospho)-2-C-methyl-D-erythritol kinase [Oscillospiraceae bacterium]